jgi:DNA polymerase III gamma/tau subunit
MLKILENFKNTEGDPFVKRISDMALEGKFPHAVLITGEGEKLGFATVAAAAILCEGKEKPCGVCSACRKIFEGIHPDVITLKLNDSAMYKAEDIRKIKSDASVKPNEASGKVYIITDADKMNLYAANSLLKVLEEPPKSVYFILISDDEKDLIGTILSRTVRFRISPSANGENKGDVSIIKTFLSGDGYESLRAISGVTYKKNELLLFLDSVAELFKNILVKRMVGEALSGDEEGILMSDERLSQMIEEIERLKDFALRNVSAPSVLMMLYLKLRR